MKLIQKYFLTHVLFLGDRLRFGQIHFPLADMAFFNQGSSLD